MRFSIPEERNDLYCYYPEEEGDLCRVTVHSALYAGQVMPVSVQWASCLNKTESKRGQRQKLNSSSEITDLISSIPLIHLYMSLLKGVTKKDL